MVEIEFGWQSRASEEGLKYKDVRLVVTVTSVLIGGAPVKVRQIRHGVHFGP